jgi:hypothetical protein
VRGIFRRRGSRPTGCGQLCLVDGSRPELAAVAAEITEDLQTLETIMKALGVKRSATKDALAVAGERLARLKGTGRVFECSPLSNVWELESLCSGSFAKKGAIRFARRQR